MATSYEDYEALSFVCLAGHVVQFSKKQNSRNICVYVMVNCFLSLLQPTREKLQYDMALTSRAKRDTDQGSLTQTLTGGQGTLGFSGKGENLKE